MITQAQIEKIREGATKAFLDDVITLITEAEFNDRNIDEILSVKQAAYKEAFLSFIELSDAEQKKILFEHSREMAQEIKLLKVYDYMRHNHKEEFETLLKGFEERIEAAQEIIDKRFYDELNKGRS